MVPGTVRAGGTPPGRKGRPPARSLTWRPGGWRSDSRRLRRAPPGMPTLHVRATTAATEARGGEARAQLELEQERTAALEARLDALIAKFTESTCCPRKRRPTRSDTTDPRSSERGSSFLSRRARGLALLPVRSQTVTRAHTSHRSRAGTGRIRSRPGSAGPCQGDPAHRPSSPHAA